MAIAVAITANAQQRRKDGEDSKVRELVPRRRDQSGGKRLRPQIDN
jgi:hypothetical protein